jgi:hypothetical protein
MVYSLNMATTEETLASLIKDAITEASTKDSHLLSNNFFFDVLYSTRETVFFQIKIYLDYQKEKALME